MALTSFLVGTAIGTVLGGAGYLMFSDDAEESKPSISNGNSDRDCDDNTSHRSSRDSSRYSSSNSSSHRS